MATFLVEHFWPDVTEAEFRAATDRVRASTGELAGLRLLYSTFVPADEAAFCVFDADSADVVAEAYRRAGVRFERILDALEVD